MDKAILELNSSPDPAKVAHNYIEKLGGPGVE